jgi:hypothetical protein
LTTVFQQLFEPLLLPDAAKTIYTVPPASTLLHGRVRFVNTDGSPHEITAYAVPSGSAPGATNAFMTAEVLAANSHIDIDLPVLAANDFFSAFGDTADEIVVFNIDGVLFS